MLETWHEWENAKLRLLNFKHVTNFECDDREGILCSSKDLRNNVHREWKKRFYKFLVAQILGTLFTYLPLAGPSCGRSIYAKARRGINLNCD